MGSANTCYVALAVLSPCMIGFGLTAYAGRICACPDELLLDLAATAGFCAAMVALPAGMITAAIRVIRGTWPLAARGIGWANLATAVIVGIATVVFGEEDVEPVSVFRAGTTAILALAVAVSLLLAGERRS